MSLLPWGRKRHAERQAQEYVTTQPGESYSLREMARQAHALRLWSPSLVPFAEELEAQISDTLDIGYAEWLRATGQLPWQN